MSENQPETTSPVNRTRTHPFPPQEFDTMDRLFQALFYRIAILYSRTIPKQVRRLEETAVLVMAVSCMSILVYLHLIYSHQPSQCLSHLQNVWPRHGILRVELFLEAPPENYDLGDSYAREHQHDSNYFQEKPFANETSINSTNDSSIVSLETNVTVTPVQRTDGDHFESMTNYFFDLDWWKDLLIEDRLILEYSLEYGFLRLSPSTRQRLNIEVLFVKLDLTNNTCFGSGLSRFILDQFVGYQEVLMSSIKHLAEKENPKGFVRNVLTNDHFRFVSATQSRRWWTYSVALCIMVIFTVSISMLLRYSHFQIFLFIIDLLRMIEHNASVVFPAAPLLTVILALIGMEAIMSEFFNDASTAFYVILIVWIADQYDSICCHTALSKRHWVRFFYIYHFSFYAYHARYNGQYSGLALTTSCCFIFHSMLYFFHHYELPIIEAQLNLVDDQQPFIQQNSIATQTTNPNDEREQTHPPPPSPPFDE